MDGKSTDGTIEVLENNNERIAYWESEPDNGVYDAMNKALAHVSGDWIYFLGADDELLCDFSGLALELEDNGGIYYANVFADGTKRLGKLTRYQFAKFGPYHQAIIYPKAVFKKYKYNTKYLISADFALTITLCGDPEFHFIYKDLVIAKFNHEGLSGQSIDDAFQKDKEHLVLKNFGIITLLRYKIHKYKNKGNPRA
jgi:glycosyltransferase involved in cell wall biosynthesis